MTQLIEIEKTPTGFKAMLPDRSFVEATGKAETDWHAAKLIGDVLARRVFSYSRVARGLLFARFYGEPFEKTAVKKA